jgi:putative endonuclease
MSIFYTYIIQSSVSDKYYIGFTHDLKSRLIAHNHSKNKGYTRKFQPWLLVYYKPFNTKEEAIKHEDYLKSLKSKIALREIIKNSACSLGSYPDVIGT